MGMSKSPRTNRARQLLEDRLRAHEEFERKLQEREDRRKRRLRLLTFGWLGRA